MLQFLTALASASGPAPIGHESLPAFPDKFLGRVQEECDVEMISDPEGRLVVLDLSGCEDHFAQAVRDRLPWMTWKTPPPLDDDVLEASYAVLTGYAGVPGGLYVRMGVRFERKGDEEPVVSVVPMRVVTPKKAQKLEIAAEVREDVGDGCTLLVHVDEDGRTERVQAQTCSEQVRAALELPLMAWTWQPLEVDGRPRAFAATFRLTPERLMEAVAD